MASADRHQEPTLNAAEYSMITRCPECQTTFHVSVKQLAERDGLVRCGRCHSVFRGDEQLLSETEPEQALQQADYPTLQESDVANNKPPIKGKKRDKKKKKAAYNDPLHQDQYYTPLPTVKELLHGVKPSARTRPVFWFIGIVLLTISLPLQYLYFYSSELARHAPLTPYVMRACEIMGCIIMPWEDVNLVELSNPIVEPHTKYENALHIEATLINRAQESQPFPRMEISLIDRQGEVITRRIFSPKQYLQQAQTQQNMLPNIAVPVTVEVTHPSQRTEGYEIRLLPS